MAEPPSKTDPDFPPPNSPPSVEGEEKGIPLTRLEPGKRAKVAAIQGGWGVKRRLNQMGIHPGDLVTVTRHGPLGGPIAIEVHGFQLALGRGVASQVFVDTTGGLTIALAGQPNSGKSTLFNHIAGYKAMTANFPGTSVTFTETRTRIDGLTCNCIALPGTYSLTSEEPAELEARRALERVAHRYARALGMTPRDLLAAVQPDAARRAEDDSAAAEPDVVSESTLT